MLNLFARVLWRSQTPSIVRIGHLETADIPRFHKMANRGTVRRGQVFVPRGWWRVGQRPTRGAFWEIPKWFGLIRESRLCVGLFRPRVAQSPQVRPCVAFSKTPSIGTRSKIDPELDPASRYSPWWRRERPSRASAASRWCARSLSLSLSRVCLAVPRAAPREPVCVGARVSRFTLSLRCAGTW